MSNVTRNINHTRLWLLFALSQAKSLINASLLSVQGKQTGLAADVIAIYSLTKFRYCKKIIQVEKGR